MQVLLLDFGSAPKVIGNLADETETMLKLVAAGVLKGASGGDDAPVGAQSPGNYQFEVSNRRETCSQSITIEQKGA